MKSIGILRITLVTGPTDKLGELATMVNA